MILKLYEQALVSELSTLRGGKLVAFALCCATRQYIAFEQYAKKFDKESESLYLSIVDRLWCYLTNAESIGDDGLNEILESVLRLFPEEQDSWSPYHVYAEHALASLAYTIRCINHDSPQEAAWSARRAYEAADQVAIRTSGIDTSSNSFERDILSSNIVQAELARQKRDLTTLCQNELNLVLHELKKSSYSESVVPECDLGK